MVPLSFLLDQEKIPAWYPQVFYQVVEPVPSGMPRLILGSLTLRCRFSARTRHAEVLRRLADILTNARWAVAVEWLKLFPTELEVRVLLTRVEGTVGYEFQPDEIPKPFQRWFGDQNVKVDITKQSGEAA